MASQEGSSHEEPEIEEEEDEELAAMKKKFKEMQEEAERLEQIQKQVEDQMNPKGSGGGGYVDAKDADKRSIYVGNVDYGATPKELQDHFSSCGTINRVTILCDKFSGHPKGFAYIEFLDEESVSNAMVMNESLFRGRALKVTPKRTNLPGLAVRGGGGGGGGGGYYAPPFRGGGFRRGGGGGRGFSRPRSRRAFYHPYQ